MAMFQGTQAFTTVNETVDNLISGKAIQNIPFDAEAYSLAIAAVGTEEGITIQVYAGQRRLIESAMVSKVDAGVFPRIPENLLIADEPVLPGEVLVISATNGAEASSSLNYRVDVNPI